MSHLNWIQTRFDQLKCILDQRASDPRLFGDEQLGTVKETLDRHCEGRRTRRDKGHSGGETNSEQSVWEAQVTGGGHAQQKWYTANCLSHRPKTTLQFENLSVFYSSTHWKKLELLPPLIKNLSENWRFLSGHLYSVIEVLVCRYSTNQLPQHHQETLATDVQRSMGVKNDKEKMELSENLICFSRDLNPETENLK